MTTKSTRRKNVLVLSTMRPIPRTTKDDGKSKLALMNFYDFKKGVTDIVDQLNNYYSCCARTNFWDLVSFFYILDTARGNSKRVWCLKNSLDVGKINFFQIFEESFWSTNKTFHRKSSNEWIKNSNYTQNEKSVR